MPGKAAAEGVVDPGQAVGQREHPGLQPGGARRRSSTRPRTPWAPIRTGAAAPLRAALSEHYRLEPERLILGCGTDEIFALLNQVFLEPGDNIVQGEFGFGAYAIGARANQGEVRFAAEPNYRIDVDALLAQVDARTRLVFIANPANPTGTFIGAAEVRRLHEGLPASVVLVLDGAYAEFNTDPTFTDGLDLARTAENIVVTHTFSKLHGLAALRVGWAYAPGWRSPKRSTASACRSTPRPPARRRRSPRSPTRTSRRARWRWSSSGGPWLTQQLGGLGLEVVPSAANFVLVGFPGDARQDGGRGRGVSWRAAA